MTLEVILATAFGRDIKVQGGQAEELYQQAQAVLDRIVRNTRGQFSAFLTFGGGIDRALLFSNVLLCISVYMYVCAPCLYSWHALGYKVPQHAPAVHQARKRNGVLAQFPEEGHVRKIQPE